MKTIICPDCGQVRMEQELIRQHELIESLKKENEKLWGKLNGHT